MKRILAGAVGVLLALGSVTAALAEETFDGTVVAGDTVSVTAPFGGTVAEISLREGEQLALGDTIATLATTRVLAQEDGTVRGIFAQAGDSAEQTVMYIAPVGKFSLACNLAKAYESVDAMFVHIGEEVYIKCVKDGSHKATGTITAVNGSSYTVITDAGELYMEESVYIYRDAEYTAASRIGTGTVGRTAEQSVTGTGSILKFYVQDGEEVERGQCLFETISGTLDGLETYDSGNVPASAAGVVDSVKVSAGQNVSKGDVLCTICPRESYQVCFSIPEDMLEQVHVGDQVSVTFNWNEDSGALPVTGLVTAVSYVSDSSASDTQGTSSTTSAVTYSGYVSFDADETVRLGMTVTVTVGGAADTTDEAETTQRNSEEAAQE